MTETKSLRWKKWMERIAAHLRTRQAHPSRTVVLLPYAQLLPVATRAWSDVFASGFAPRFETTQSWSRNLGAAPSGANDFAGDAALDSLTARELLLQAGLGTQGEVLGSRLLEAAGQLAPLVAAVAPAQRAAWASHARLTVASGLEGAALALEAALAQVAVAWVANSSYETDCLFTPAALGSADALVVLQGLQAEPLTLTLQTLWQERLLLIDATQEPEDAAVQTTHAIRFRAAVDAEDEAQLAAACVVRQVQAGHAPVALVANDRALTRRIHSMLKLSQLRLRDETGWKLSTSRSAAHVMGGLRACLWNASTDQILDWLKNAPAFDAGQVDQLEDWLRRNGIRQWQRVTGLAGPEVLALTELLSRVQGLRDGMQGARTLARWIDALREWLQACGLWAVLQHDSVGEKLVSVLRLAPEVSAQWQGRLNQTLWSARKLSLSDFVQWVDQALEAASFVPPYPDCAQVVILPLAQMPARPFAAVVIPGCDEVRLNPSPEPSGLWSKRQREVLGLPSREALAGAQRLAWQQALCSQNVDVLWRQSDEGGEALLASALVQRLMLDQASASPADPRETREVATGPLVRPAPTAPSLAVERLSASAYDDLRRCPYRFFALRQLGLTEADELESTVDKRDFGSWLHAVLKNFHDALKAAPTTSAEQRVRMMDNAASETTARLQLDQEEFLPFRAIWPMARQGYLDWLAGHEAGGASFAEGESEQQQALGSIRLVGRIDRIDTLASVAGSEPEVLVIDYKTESLDKTRKRVKTPFEDTQLAFYAALLPNDTLRAAYLNIGERGETKNVDQPDVVKVRDALLEGIAQDMNRISQGATLPALGEGTACEFCAARGLCRKDFWVSS